MKNKLLGAALVSCSMLCVGGAYADFEFESGGHTYKVVTTGATYADALLAAAAATSSSGDADGYLVNIESSAENAAIAAQLASNIAPSAYASTTAERGGGSAYVWIGADDISTEGTWVWNTLTGTEAFWSGDQTGSAVGGKYNNWGTESGTQNEPDNSDRGGQNAAGIALQTWPNPSLNAGFVLGTAGQWNDLAERTQLYYIIEWDSVASGGGGGVSTPVPTLPFYALLLLSGLLALFGLKRIKG